jgi:hypothetical protein
MQKSRTPPTIVPPRFFALLVLPLAIPMLLTLALLLSLGEAWPRTIAPGSGLKLFGLCASALTCLMAWRLAIRGIADRRAHKMVALLCGVVGLIGWPVWSVGVLPSVNGFHLGSEEAERMMLERTEVTAVSRSSDRNHWAWLRPERTVSKARQGRYFISEELFTRWNRERPGSVTVRIAQGTLGAQVVTGYE